ncbi:MAG: hypothetical protein ABI164_01850, partial [Acidobacteriaceae bacterium]
LAETRMKMTFLQHVGNFFKTVFADATHVAVAVEPVVDIVFPGIGTLYNATVQAVATAETAAVAAGAGTGSGRQKLAAVMAAIEPIAVAYLRGQGITANASQIEAWTNAVVATLNALPGPGAGVSAKAA